MIKSYTKSKKYMGKIGEIRGVKLAKLDVYQLPYAYLLLVLKQD